MSFNISEIGPCKKRAEFSLTAKEVQNGFDEVYGEICETISFPGFRKGKVPRSLVAKKYSKDIVGEVKEKLIHKTFSEMVEGENIEVISKPMFDEKEKEFKEGEDFTYSVSFEVKPEFKLPDYKGIGLIKKVADVTEDKIDETQENLLKSHATLEEVEDASIEKGDYPTLHLEVEDESGDVVHHNHSFLCAVDSDQLDIFKVSKLADKLKGLKKSDHKKVSHTVAKEFPAKEELAGKKVSLKIEVEKVNRMKIPAFDDDFITKFGFKTKDDFRNMLKKMIEENCEREAKEDLKNQIYEFLDKGIDSPLPEDTVKLHRDYLVNSKMIEMVRGGMPVEEAEAKKSELEKSAEEEARREIRVGFALGKIADSEKVFVTEREVSNRIVQLANSRKMAPEKLKEDLEKNHELPALRNQLKEEKTIELLIKKAKVEEKKLEEEGAKAKKPNKKKESAKKKES